MRGGRRPGSGRKAGGVNFANAQIKLLQTRRRLKRHRSGVEIMSAVANDLFAQSEEARKNNDPKNWLRLATKAAEISEAVAQYQQPKLSQAYVAAAVAPANQRTDFTFQIFERERTPPLIDARPVEANDSGRPESSAQGSAPPDVDQKTGATREPVSEPAPKPKTYPDERSHPPPDKPDPRAPLMSFNERKSLYEHPALQPWRHGSRH